MEQVKAITTEQEAETAVQYIVVRIGNVINLRGEIIPVMSIRLKLGLEDDEFTDKTRIIIVKIEGATIGVIVDQVREVVTLDDDNTEKITRTSRDDAASGYISSIGKSKGELISLLDIVGLIVEN